MNFIPAELIKKKRRGEEHSREEILFLIKEYTAGNIPDYQMSAWLMAVCFQGLSTQETATLTLAMRDSGRVMDFSALPEKKVDKHSSGGVGDKTTLVLAPIVAASGLRVPMIAGRGLGHTGGTLDKLESIPGFRVALSEDEFYGFVRDHHLAIMGQTTEICPADKKLYALRDVTGTVDSIPLICASIMSKKMSEGLDALVLDIKFGSGAFMKTKADAITLAKKLKETGEHQGIRVAALVTDMDQPLGRFAGNSLEVKECLDILTGQADLPYYSETRELSLHLAAHMLVLGEKAKNPEDGYNKAKSILQSGQAYEKFLSLCQYQGPASLADLPFCETHTDVVAPQDGWIISMNTEQIGLATVELGAGRKVASDSVDPTAGIEFFCKVGRRVKKGEVLARLFSESDSLRQSALGLMENAYQFVSSPPEGMNRPLVVEIIT